uniref:uncharacterized protein LOC124039007 n=1 Tax=Oncorhynchus gorbuscha TaxID=8017 RepID=UPI001EAEF87D|nr:uncharacterized protein LOC124039007 [Oncorhynchus gorbuscha]
MKDEAKERNVTLAPVLPAAPVPPLPQAAPGLPAPDPPAPQGHPTSFAATTTTTNAHSPNPRRGVGGAPAPDPPRCTWADLTRNVIKGHIQEICGTYGQIDGQEIIAPAPLTGCLHNVATHPIAQKKNEWQLTMYPLKCEDKDHLSFPWQISLLTFCLHPPLCLNVSVTTETLSGSPQNSLALPRLQTPQLTRQLELLQVELPGTPDLTAPLLPHFSFHHWKSLYLKFYPASYQCVLPSNDH